MFIVIEFANANSQNFAFLERTGSSIFQRICQDLNSNNLFWKSAETARKNPLIGKTFKLNILTNDVRFQSNQRKTERTPNNIKSSDNNTLESFRSERSKLHVKWLEIQKYSSIISRAGVAPRASDEDI